MELLRFLLCILFGFLLSGVWFGLSFVIGALIQKMKISWLKYLNTLFASVIPIFLISLTLGIYPIQISGIRQIKVYVIGIVTIVITSVIITTKKTVIHKKGKEILFYGLDGLMMEIPQRMMMQSFLYGALKILGVSSLNFYTIIATGVIWCMGIISQAFLLKIHFDQDMFFDILASFVFSLGIGYVYQETGLIIITMIAHFCERILSCYIFSKRQNKLNTPYRDFYEGKAN
ncbi:CPBP family glutamic-type intramembrane protease [Lutispora thermophila]|uniref:CAAX prenyl protease 2/Lysostaphin resistance protein A-like domain-containing protein n=1 Tax=Lutispora thermophila DSM 19022 TaxID=1122184 RepID=A0A1M6IF27_9FIRM|nr:CPBP family glutamic-type intramembrane protease [Lutispora thermophila]SHJ33025.1 hypothetical protein SAMN02745176_03223 [Lutispora thermophila DSM 19022]